MMLLRVKVKVETEQKFNLIRIIFLIGDICAIQCPKTSHTDYVNCRCIPKNIIQV